MVRPRLHAIAGPVWDFGPVTTSGPLFGSWPTRRLVIFSLARILLAIVLVLGLYALLPTRPTASLATG